jgi:TonB family protein
MGKIVKYCGSCDEGFAEKFGFCPNCGQTLQTFEMNPLDVPAPATSQLDSAPALTDAPEAKTMGTAPVLESTPVEEPVYEEQIADDRSEETVVRPTAAAAAASTIPVFQAKAMDADRTPVSLENEHNAYADEGGYYVTVIEEKHVKRRNALLLGSLGFVVFVLLSSTVYSLFNKDLDVASINDDIFNALLVELEPMTVEQEQLKVKKDKEAGGGGGGGREEKEEVTQGDLANQTKDPIRPPDAKVPRFDSELKLPPPSTEGNKTFEKKFDRWGDPNGRFASFSNGTGSGGGQGSGVGTGQGSGRGTGAGSGTGSGYGGGLGSGNGNGTGAGDAGSGNPPPPPPVGVTQGLKILSKPRPGYTDSARQANIQGTVILRVTFLASGAIGSISPVKGLPSGLTEQAIAAAKRISFEPAKRNGIGQSVTRQIEYTFSIY